MADLKQKKRDDQSFDRFVRGFFEIDSFADTIVQAYEEGGADRDLPADVGTALSWIPPGTAAYRDFSTISPEIPLLDAEKCVGCMECVTQCPDTAIIAKVVPESEHEKLRKELHEDEQGPFIESCFAETTKYFKVPKKKGNEGGLFMLVVDPSKCKGCGECVTACGTHDALTMQEKTDELMEGHRASTAIYRRLPDTPPEYIQEKVLADMMLAESSFLYVGGAGSCMGCGEVTAIRMMLAATSFVHGKQSMGIVAATGCNSVYGSTYPYNPYLVPWTNSLFENAPAVALGIRGRWDAMGMQDKHLWVFGGDGAMLDIGFQALSRLMMSGMDINVLILDTQVYSNTGGQSSTSTFTSQDAKMSIIGKEQHGKSERRKEIAHIALMHPNVFVAQTTAAHVNHFYRAIIAANEYPGPAIINVYTPCQPEHGIGDDASVRQAKLAVDSRAFPLLIHDPRKGELLSERLSLQGNPARGKDWYVTAKGDVVDFIAFARTEGRFSKQFDKQGNPSEDLKIARQERLDNWHLLQELAGLR